MKFVSFTADHTSYGIAVDGGVFDLGARNPILPTLKSYLSARALDLVDKQLSAHLVDYADGEFRYDPVIRNPNKILCVASDDEYSDARPTPLTAYPSISVRFPDTLIGHEAQILLPPASNALDHEGELAVVIGRSGVDVPESAALEFVAGYACFNDTTLRDWQHHGSQFTPGKNFRGTGPLGPYLVTPDEVGALGPQRIETRLGGEIRQSAILGDMTFSVSRVISYISAFTPLHPGDVIAMGRPCGADVKRAPPRYMRAGEIVEISIEGVGILRNPVARE
jgi:2-keto-4-pentenoate hydratase/2-oxohepta-3-ene-1,7-dioic acid hydratase in catechol pathway